MSGRLLPLGWRRFRHGAAPTSQLLWRMLGDRRDPLGRATRQWVVHPRETSVAPSAIFLEDQLARVRALAPTHTWEGERRRIGGGEIEHGPTEAFALRHAVIAGASIYSSRSRHRVGPDDSRPWFISIRDHRPQAAVCSSFAGSVWFAHWLLDDASTELLAAELAPPCRHDRAEYRHEPEYRSLLGLHAERLDATLVDEILVFRDIGQNRHKADRYRELRRRLRASLGPIDPSPGVFLLRGMSGASRDLANAEEVAERLRSRGFEIVDPDRASAREIARALLEARIVVGVEGSQLSHYVYAIAESGGLLVIQPPHRFSCCMKDYADALGLHFGFVVGEGANDGFRVDPEDLERTLDLLEAELGA